MAMGRGVGGLGGRRRGRSLLSSSAMDEEGDEKEKEEKAKKGKAVGVGAGAASGAAAGTAVMPGWGTLIGAAVGAGSALIQQNQAEKAGGGGERPKRRRLTRVMEKAEEGKQRRITGLMALSQAVSDFAANVR